MQITSLLPFALLGSVALARPAEVSTSSSILSALLRADPTTASCDGAPAPSECATAAQAAPLIEAAMRRFCIHETPVVAALVDLMLFETGAFKYNRNHFPGRPGQGTRNMQMFDFNFQYALDTPALKSQAIAIAGGESVDADSISDDKKNEILALVMADEYTFASAAWFLTTKCPATIKQGLATGGDAGYEAYLTSCIGTTAAPERLEHWKVTKEAFGV
ncbi:hypothetical protein B0T11DRAFT_69498 [Plectosphaerella cucumerina]|jgi:hypothetical protein|uniref:Uncharacterized protein n=1 Tax=Plectosphaerella cucumerina TaxID=40658 RepID=A0A8K0TP32_9PEZI|nr:hypothetical protein B0T11DRAFT_69498 [Plectosphaerella cucumerina]